MYLSFNELFKGGSFGRYVQRKLLEVDFWIGNFGMVKEDLRLGVVICERWVGVCEILIIQFWKSFRLYLWKGEKYVLENLKQFVNRLEEVIQIYNKSFKFKSFKFVICMFVKFFF